MKKIFSVIAIAAMAMFAFSCKPDNPTPDDIDNIVEDGVYVMLGDKIVAEYAMAGGFNEAADQAARDGMYEKYIVLDKDQEFTLAYKAGEKILKYGAELKAFTPEALTGVYDGNPKTAVLKGALVEGEKAPKMKASEKGLYHIVLDLNKDGKLDNPQILLVNTHYGIRGAMISESWDYAAMEAGELSNEGTTYTITGLNVKPNQEFKFAYNSAWKITLDAAGLVKANTNLGKDCVPGGDNIAIAESGAYTITLKFVLKGGPVKNSWSYTITRTGDMQVEPINPAASGFMVGVSGGNWGNWADPNPAAVYNAAESSVTDAAKFSGKYVFDIAEIEMKGSFKIRINGAWIGPNDATVEGLETSTDSDGNFAVAEAAEGNYSAKFSFDWDGNTNSHSNVKVVFTAAAPAEPKVTVDGDAADWALLDAKYVTVVESAEGAALNVIKSLKVYYDDKVYFLVELTDDALAYSNKMRFHVFVNSDWSADGGYNAHWTRLNINYALEGKIMEGGNFVNLSSALYACVPGTAWATQNTGITPTIVSAGKDKFYEFSVWDDAFAQALKSTIGVGIEIMDSDYNAKGILPNDASGELATVVKKGTEPLEALPALPEPATAAITLDGNFEDWEDIEKIEDEGTEFAEWKYTYDADNIYFLFKIKRSKIIANREAETEGENAGKYGFYKRRYIYIGLDTDNNPETPSADKPNDGTYLYGDMQITGCEAVALVYPFRGFSESAGGTDGSKIVNGLDDRSWVRNIGANGVGGSRTGDQMEAWGTIDEEYGTFEVNLPRAHLGAAGTYKIQLSLASDLSTITEITVE